MTPQEIRAARLANPDKRDRDLADHLGISEAQLVAAHVGQGVTRIDGHPDQLLPQVSLLGEVMALTRNASVVHERVGTYGEYRSGAHASMVLGEEIDLRIFPKHWVHGFAVEKRTDAGPRRSLQVFDAAGDAIHKIHLRDTSNHDAWDAIVATLSLDGQSDALTTEPRAPVDGAKIREDNRDLLLAEWARMTDTHQFNRISAKLGMNRLGAYRLVSGGEWVRPLAPEAVSTFFDAASAARQGVVLFVGNRGNIQIHWGTLDNIKPMGPWLNVLDARFNLHLRGDRIAEVYAVTKPTKRGPALSVEAFAADGELIFQVFGRRADEEDDLSAWADLVATLPARNEVPA